MLEIQYCEVMGFRMAIEGMRNPLNSWDKGDSEIIKDCTEKDIECFNCPYLHINCKENMFHIGEKDMKLAKSLIKAGSSDRKFLRMIHVQADVLAPLYFWKEADTYKVGTTMNSCSTMHTIHKKDFTLDDFSHEHLYPVYDGKTFVTNIDGTITLLNILRKEYIRTKDKKLWYQMIQMLPSSYNQMRTWDLDYETLLNIYFQRRNHKLDEWHTFCDWILGLPYMKEFISVLDKEKEDSNEQ